jgi:hypothetical protein
MSKRSLLLPLMVLGGIGAAVWMAKRNGEEGAAAGYVDDTPPPLLEEDGDDYAADVGLTLFTKRVIGMGTKVYSGSFVAYFYLLPKPATSSILDGLTHSTLTFWSSSQPGGIAIAASQLGRGYMTAPTPTGIQCFIRMLRYRYDTYWWQPGDQCYWKVTYPGYKANSAKSFTGV